WALTQGSLQLEAAIDAAAGESRLSAETNVLVTWRSGVSVVARALKVTGAELPWGPLTLGVDDLEGDARYAADGWRLDGSGKLHAAGSLAGAMVEDLTTRWSGTVSGTPERVVLGARECVDWNVAAIELGELR